MDPELLALKAELAGKWSGTPQVFGHAWREGGLENAAIPEAKRRAELKQARGKLASIERADIDAAERERAASRRSKMSAEEEAEFVSQHGFDQYQTLNW